VKGQCGGAARSDAYNAASSISVTSIESRTGTGSGVTGSGAMGAAAKSIVELVLVCEILLWNVERVWIKAVTSVNNEDWEVLPSGVGSSAVLHTE